MPGQTESRVSKLVSRTTPLNQGCGVRDYPETRLLSVRLSCIQKDTNMLHNIVTDVKLYSTVMLPDMTLLTVQGAINY